MSNTPFPDRMYPCARCRRDVRVKRVFSHFRSMHDETLLSIERDGSDVCGLCAMELPAADENNAWKLRVRHFREYHGKRLVDTDAV